MATRAVGATATKPATIGELFPQVLRDLADDYEPGDERRTALRRAAAALERGDKERAANLIKGLGR